MKKKMMAASLAVAIFAPLAYAAVSQQDLQKLIDGAKEAQFGRLMQKSGDLTSLAEKQGRKDELQAKMLDVKQAAMDLKLVQRAPKLNFEDVKAAGDRLAKAQREFNAYQEDVITKAGEASNRDRYLVPIGLIVRQQILN